MNETDESNEALTRAAIRLYQRYAVEVVERYDLCPWAARARRDGSVKPVVLHQRTPDDLAASLAAIDELAEVPAVIIALLIYPRMTVSRRDFDQFLRRLRQADAERHAVGHIPFAMAAFHPEAEADLTDPDRLIPFVRRTPDPTLQLVRRTALDAVTDANPRGTAFAEVWMMSPAGVSEPAGPTVRERIGLRNLQTVQRVGAATLEAVLRDIAADRTETYAALAGREPDPVEP